ncbi:MAG TPA: hypothetical protein PLB31_04215 [Fimbriimonadaceae bacterium]|nr:hypothetical protein [Armatimonadota bacterium]HRD31614.1 hypothetical protein [Fimbriimonadaceae bacterium]HRE93346.1 hypothetical protein [Fimbriimonadaceae bacterium]HRI73657.1 hypothetical protein [Fimbriimonadaceae bacterium]
MLISTLALATSLQTSPQYVDISRVFKAGETSKYAVRSRLQMETRQLGQTVFLPSSVRIDYDFTLNVKQMLDEGFAVHIYRRPTMTITDGETASSPPRKNVEQTNINYEMTLSPANEMTNAKALVARWAAASSPAAPAPQDLMSVVGQFTGELQRLALFTGSLDSGMDLSPKLPYDEVRVGDTWKRTVGYSPQRIANSDKAAVQRLDYTFTYKGVMEANGQKFHRVQATMSLDSNAAEFVNQSMGMTPGQSGLEAINLKLDATIDFDLDLNTRKTLRALAVSKGGYDVRISQVPGQPVLEQKLSGRSQLSLAP